MICPFCKEEIADGAIKCKHCQSMLNVPPPTAAPVAHKEINENEGADEYPRLRAMFEGKEYRVVLGLPIFSNFRDQFSAFWPIALLYSPLNFITYAIGGMWKKGITLIGAYILVFLVMKVGGDSVIGLGLLILVALAVYVGIAMHYQCCPAKVR